MLNSNIKTHDIISCLTEIGLSKEDINELSFLKGFSKRNSGKINAAEFISLLLSESVSSSPSYNDLAAKLDKEFGVSVTKQAIAKKINNSCLKLIKAILAYVISQKSNLDSGATQKLCQRYDRVIVQDSTIIKLPVQLFDEYSGVSNAHCSVCNARIQVAFDLIAGDFILFSIDSYSKNDFKAAPDLKIQQNDLVLRDRGYLTNSEIQRHIHSKAECIYRHKHYHSYYDSENGTKIDLLKLLKKKKSIDMQVFLKDNIPIRIVAEPVENKVAKLRRAKLKKEHRGHKPTKELLQIMSWTIFITTIPKSEAEFNDLLSLYSLRWRIEIIFKAWKSNMNFSRLHNVSNSQLKILIFSRFTTFVIINSFIYIPGQAIISQHFDQKLSLIKVTRYFSRNLDIITKTVTELFNFSGINRTIEALAKYCCYDKRERQNFSEKIESLLKCSSLG